MRHFHLKRNKYFCPTVNLDKIWTLVSDQTRQEYKKKTDKAPIIDVVRAVSPVGLLNKDVASGCGIRMGYQDVASGCGIRMGYQDMVSGWGIRVWY